MLVESQFNVHEIESLWKITILPDELEHYQNL